MRTRSQTLFRPRTRLIKAFALLAFWTIAASVVLNRPAAADFIAGRTLLGLCASNRPAVQAYVAGMYDQSTKTVERLHILREKIFAMPGLESAQQKDLERYVDEGVALLRGYCLPATVSLRSVGDALCRYVEGHRETADAAASEIFVVAMQVNWPCDGNVSPGR